jgi:ABC-type phosphate transport system substrate-binding protein
MKTIGKKFVFATTALLILGLPVRSIAQDFKVVVNDANPLTTIAAEELSRIFLKKTEAWSNGVPAVPIDQESENEVREAFSLAIHGRSAYAIKAYWQRMVFSGRAVPPAEKTSDEEVLNAVRANPGAVGYVSASTRVGDGVKVVDVT